MKKRQKTSRPTGEKSPGEAARSTAMQWFRNNGWDPFDFQLRTWEAYLADRSGLIHAPTGIGKTYAAWFGPVIEWLSGAFQSTGTAPVPDDARQPKENHLRVLWVTPLRALVKDIQAALTRVTEDLDMPWAVETRTGDTPASVKSRQKKKLPEVLITTPESLALMMSYPGAREQFAGLRMVVVDEWHELLGSKRGVLAELALARLKSWNSGIRIWGLSATLGNTDKAMEVLLGRSADRGCLIKGAAPKSISVESIIPAEVERFPWSGHLGMRLLNRAIDEIELAETSLIFTNTRSQTETWYQAILEKRPDWQNRFALHHGSLDKGRRDSVEQGLRDGSLKGVVCTSSLDLGVDFTPVDLIFQIGSPKGIARLMQRAGRSGHQPGSISRIICVPTNALELIEVTAARFAVNAGDVEPRTPIRLPLDVLAQHLVSVALGDGFEPTDFYRELTGTHAFRSLSRRDFNWVLDFVSTGGASLSAYQAYRKIGLINGRYTCEDRQIAARHRMHIGTITSDASIRVKFLNGQRLGTVEERFVSRLKRGDTFVYGGRQLEYVRIRDMTLWVRKSKSGKGPVPQWLGGRMPLSTELASAVRYQLELAGGGIFTAPEMKAVRPILELQARWSAIPGRNDLLIEKCVSREGHHLFVFPFEGHLVNEGIAALLAHRLCRKNPLTLSFAVNDYGLELLSDREVPLEEFQDSSIFTAAGLMEDILESVNTSEMGRRQFREIARVAGLVFQGYPGRRKKARQVQASSSLLYNVFQRYEPTNLLLKQSTREVLERQLEFSRLDRSLKRIGKNRIRFIRTGQITPLAFPIMVNRLRTRISSEKLADRVRRMQLRLEKQADR